MEIGYSLRVRRIIILAGIMAIIWMAAADREAGAIEPRYDNPGQGLFLCHYDKGTPEYAKGTGWIIYWGELQPRDPRTLANPADSLDRTKLNTLINRLKSGKNMYIHTAFYNAQGKADEVVYPPWLRIRRIVYSRGNYPNIWDEEYRVRIKEFLTLLGDELEKAGVLDKIEYFEMAAGGNWAAPEWWLSDNDLNVWLEAAGCEEGDYKCFGRKVNEGVDAMIDIYAQSLPKNALMMVEGSCKYTDCNYGNFGRKLDLYGMRLMIKGAGLGGRIASCGYKSHFGTICGDKTKCGQEPWGPSVNCKGAGMGFDPGAGCGDDYALTYRNSLWREKVSYYCIYGDDLFCQDQTVRATNQSVADHLGAQIKLVMATLSKGEVRVGERISLNSKWQNLGSTPLMAPLKQGLKWTPTSYRLFLEYVDEAGQTTMQVLADDLGTINWGTTKNFLEKEVGVGFEIPASLGGESETAVKNYKVYIGWVDPNGENKRFGLVNEEAANDKVKRRYKIADNLVVRGRRMSPTATPTQRPSPTVTRQPSATPSQQPANSPTPGGPTTSPTATPTGGQPTTTPTPVGPTATGGAPTPSNLPSGNCPREFSCYHWRGEYQWFATDWEMSGFERGEEEECHRRGMSKPEYLGKERGDANCDGRTDGGDYSLWRKEAKDQQPTRNSWQADFNQDGRVDDEDLRIWRREYNDQLTIFNF